MKGKDYNVYRSLLMQKNVPAIHPRKLVISTRKSNKTPIKYIWKSSIPTRWFEIVDHSRFQSASTERARDTLQFLKETLQYIHTIRRNGPGTEPLLVPQTIQPSRSRKLLRVPLVNKMPFESKTHVSLPALSSPRNRLAIVPIRLPHINQINCL